MVKVREFIGRHPVASVSVGTVFMVRGMAVPSYATASPDADVISTLTGASSSLKDTLVAVAVIGLAVGVVMFAIRKGWRLIKGFSS